MLRTWIRVSSTAYSKPISSMIASWLSSKLSCTDPICVIPIDQAKRCGSDYKVDSQGVRTDRDHNL
jgi:hypothetical protein